MKISAVIKNQLHKNEITVSTNTDSKCVIIPSKPAGYGSSVNGAELLLLSLATCYCNDIYREASKRHIEVYEVTVECTGEFGAEGEPGKNFQYKPTIRSNATPEQLDDLIQFTDQTAEIHKTLRQGLNISLLR
ncbi:MAG TPA: OsmC family protein [Puia sp.]|nr:OsmC family protein [Puia sp.]